MRLCVCLCVIIVIIIIMDGTCIAQLFPSRKLNALAHTIHIIYTDINIIYPSTHTHTHTMVPLDLWKCLLKKESFELGFEVREGGEIPQAGRQRIPDSWGNETERTVANRFETVLDFSKNSGTRMGGCVESDVCRKM